MLVGNATLELLRDIQALRNALLLDDLDVFLCILLLGSSLTRACIYGHQGKKIVHQNVSFRPPEFSLQ
jgi:hypothetical protein